MSRYYYFVASLPSLSLTAPAPVTLDDFTAGARQQLSPPDIAELDALLAGQLDSVRQDFSRDWLNANRQLRNAAARTRALRLGVDERKYQREHTGFRVDAEGAVDDAFSRANPLERELALDRYRWALADELSLGDPFGLPAILAYAVKLNLCLRWQALTPEKGRERLEEIVGNVGVSTQEMAGWSGLARL
mgnify:CR=1 FL=1